MTTLFFSNFVFSDLDSSIKALRMVFGVILFGLIYGLQKAYFYKNSVPAHNQDKNDNNTSEHKAFNNNMIDFKHENKTIQESMLVIQSFLKFIGVNNLSTLSSNSHQNDIDLCKIVLLELFSMNYLQVMIKFLHDNNKTSRFFAEALANLIVIALDIPGESALLSISNLLCISCDSFIYKFIVLSINGGDLTTFNGLCGSSINTYDSFLDSATPSIGSIGLFFSKVPIINWLFYSCKMMNYDDVIPVMFRYLADKLIDDINQIQAEFWKAPSLLSSTTSDHTGPDIFSSPTDGTTDGDSDSFPFDNENCVILTTTYDEDERFMHENTVITPMNASFKTVFKYRSHFYSIKSKIEKLLLDLNPFESVQCCVSIARSPLISPGLSKLKNVFRSLLVTFKQAEVCLVQFERAFVIFQLCEEEIVSNKDITSKLTDMAMTASRNPIEKNEMEVLEELVYKNMNMINNLSEAFRKSSCCLDGELKQKCQDLIMQVSNQCEDLLECFKKVEHTWKQLLPMMAATQSGMVALDSVNLTKEYLEKNYDLAEYSLRHVQNEIFAVEYHKFISFLAVNGFEVVDGMSLLNKASATDSPNTVVTKKLINGMIQLASKELTQFKDNIQGDLAILKKFKDQQSYFVEE